MQGETTKADRCPYCGGTLEEGVFYAGARPFFLPAGEKPSWFSRTMTRKRGAIMFPINWVGENYVTAYACRDCKMIIIPYGAPAEAADVAPN